MRRWLAGLLVTLALLALAAALVAAVDVWAAVYPRSTALQRAARWPLVGPYVRRVQARHAEGALPKDPPHPSWVWVLGGDPADGEAAGTPAAGRLRALPEEPAPRLPPGVWREVWLRQGQPLLAEPRRGAAAVAQTTSVANVPVLEARGDWRRVVWRGREGWVRVDPQTGPPLGSAPEPVRPLPGHPPDPARLAAARELLGIGASERRAGPYALLSDVDEPALQLQLDRAARGLESVYRQRYGVTPIGAPAEAVVVFRQKATYDAYLARTGGLRADTGHVAGGVVALYREGRLPEDVRATLVHELVHVLNRRALGPALPAWLDEGLADDLGQSRVDAEGSMLPGSLSASTLRAGVFYEVHGGEAAQRLLRHALASGEYVPLDRLLAMDDAQFHGFEPRALVYSEASFLVRFLLAGEHAAGFRAFLAALADGGDPTATALEKALGTPLTRLDDEMRAWLQPPP